ncbi:TRAP transporter small permease [uncultured Ruegeria sp.]|uniref:TRAP transporter small permease n=1 Tax=uncultured Ruegeria sp. TaxID=259304 RepID=UPI0026388EEC|nr:TRAP transporter small permease [uncultured Ruegeria sp.]
MIELADQLPPKLGQTVRRLIKIKSAFLMLSTFILALTFFMVVLLRYVLKSDLFAYEEWLMPMCFWLFFLGSAVGTYEDSQIKADILESWLTNPTIVWWRKVIITSVELVVTCFLIYWAILMLRDEIASYPQWQTTIALRIPFFVPRLGIFVGFSFMAFYSALHLYVLLKFRTAGVIAQMDKSGITGNPGKGHP